MRSYALLPCIWDRDMKQWRAAYALVTVQVAAIVHVTLKHSVYTNFAVLIYNGVCSLVAEDWPGIPQFNNFNYSWWLHASFLLSIKHFFLGFITETDLAYILGSHCLLCIMSAYVARLSIYVDPLAHGLLLQEENLLYQGEWSFNLSSIIFACLILSWK